MVKLSPNIALQTLHAIFYISSKEIIYMAIIGSFLNEIKLFFSSKKCVVVKPYINANLRSLSPIPNYIQITSMYTSIITGLFPNMTIPISFDI